MWHEQISQLPQKCNRCVCWSQITMCTGHCPYWFCVGAKFTRPMRGLTPLTHTRLLYIPHTPALCPAATRLGMGTKITVWSYNSRITQSPEAARHVSKRAADCLTYFYRVWIHLFYKPDTLYTFNSIIATAAMCEVPMTGLYRGLWIWNDG